MNKLIGLVASTLGVKQVFSSSYYPQGHGHIENVHNFMKIYIWKHIPYELACEEVVQIACAAYNCVPIKHSKESRFFLIFGRDVYTPLVHLLNPKHRYVGNVKSLDGLWDSSVLVIHYILLPRERWADKFLTYPIPEFNVADEVLVRNHTWDVWNPIWCCLWSGTSDWKTNGINGWEW